MLPDLFWRQLTGRVVACALFTLALSACASGEHLNESDRDEDSSRPGILSGSSGEFVIYGG
jgi:hypothetical protein